MYAGIVKNVTISIEDELWQTVREAAASNRVSMNAFIRDILRQSVRRTGDSAAERFAALAEASGPAPKSWKWNREEIYEDAI